jgi:hypothetical protein
MLTTADRTRLGFGFGPGFFLAMSGGLIGATDWRLDFHKIILSLFVQYDNSVREN